MSITPLPLAREELDHLAERVRVTREVGPPPATLALEFDILARLVDQSSRAAALEGVAFRVMKAMRAVSENPGHEPPPLLLTEAQAIEYDRLHLLLAAVPPDEPVPEPDVDEPPAEPADEPAPEIIERAGAVAP